MKKLAEKTPPHSENIVEGEISHMHGILHRGCQMLDRIKEHLRTTLELHESMKTVIGILNNMTGVKWLLPFTSSMELPENNAKRMQ